MKDITKYCLICNKNNWTLYWHKSDDTGDIWCYCNACSKGYSIQYYCYLAGISLKDFLKQKFNFVEAAPNEVTKMEWPRNFIPLFDSKAKEGLEYLKYRGLEPDSNLYYDVQRKGIVFPYYYEGVFCGAQIRLIKPWIDEEGKPRKIDTLPATRLSLVFYNWDQREFLPHIKGLIITEGSINALSVQQALDNVYGSLLTNPWKVIAASGSGASKHHLEIIKDNKNKGIKVILAPDSDKAGIGMFKKYVDAQAITHYALTGNDELDWNDIYKTTTKYEFVKWFFKQVNKI